MIIDFTVENYRSIKTAMTLSAVAQNRNQSNTAETDLAPTGRTLRRKVKPDDEIAQPYRVPGRNIDLLPVLGIFGANASGKTNIIRALDDLLAYMARGARENSSNRLGSFVPFRLQNKPRDTTTRFELRTVFGSTIFTYSLELDPTRILVEKLEFIPPPPKRKINRLLFERVWSPKKDEYDWKNGSNFGNDFIKIQRSLQPQIPFMRVLASSLEVDLLKDLCKWLTHRWSGLTLGYEYFDYWLTRKLLGDVWPERQNVITNIIKAFDTGITGIKVVQVKDQNPNDEKDFEVFVEHRLGDQMVQWPLQEESTGTQRLFTLAYKTLDVFYWGGVLLVDELGSNIHPLITRTIIRAFQNSDTNPKRGQLIFTSHDNTLQRGLLRRDQIWFTQKAENASTELYSLSDFHPRNDLAIDRAYLDGRFGAVPVLPPEEELLSLARIE